MPEVELLTGLSRDLELLGLYDQLDVMGRVWGIDTIAKNDSTSIYGSAIMISESPLQEGLIYVGTDDGVLNATDDNGATWSQTTKFAKVPDMTYIDDVLASSHDADVVYAVLENHKRGDYKPYVLKSENRGRSWKSISSNLPERGSAHTIVEDHVDPNLLFVGTEFGLFVTQDGGGSWHQLKGNFPTIAVRDLEIQVRENDLVVGTFGRGIYILDDYTALRTKAADLGEFELFGVRDPWLFIEGDLWGGGEKGSSGDAFFRAPNPPQGAVFTYYLKDGLKSQKAARREREIEVEKAGGDTSYPAWDVMRAEDREQDPTMYILIRDADGSIVRQVSASSDKGLQRSAWDLRLPPPDPINLAETDRSPWMPDPVGPMVLPGEYTARLATLQNGVLNETGESQTFTVKPLEASPEITNDRRALQAFQIKVAGLQRAVAGSSAAMAELQNRIAHVRVAIVETPAAGDAERDVLQQLTTRLADVEVAISGDSTIGGRNEPVPMSIDSRASNLYYNLIFSQSAAGGNYKDSYAVAAEEFSVTLRSLSRVDTDLAALENALEIKGAPWTPGRIPDWSPE